MIAQPANTTIIIPSQGRNPLAKPGWNLVFNDDFETLNLHNWDLSNSAAHSSWNPDPNAIGDDLPCCHMNRRAFEEPRQVSSDGNNCVIAAEIADNSSPCLGTSYCPNPRPDNCTYMRTGEIKTFSWDRDHESFRDWLMPTNSYIDIRAKVGSPLCDSWSSFWFYGYEPENKDKVGQEIDGFEMVPFGPGQFTAGYWTGYWVNGKYVPIYDENQQTKVVDRGFVIKESKEIYIIQKRYIRDGERGSRKIVYDTIWQSKITDAHLDEGFYNYGVEFYSDRLVFYLNGVKYFDWSLGNSAHDLPPISPKYIKIGQGIHHDYLPCKTCATKMYIDYVRAYTQSNNFVKWITYPPIMNIWSNLEFKSTYLPSLSYVWNFSNFNVANFQYEPNRALVTCQQNIQSGKIHNVSINTTFPDGRVEVLPAQIYVQGAEAPPQPKYEIISTKCVPGSNIEIKFRANYMYPNIICNQNQGVYQWSINGGNFIDGTEDFTAIIPNQVGSKVQLRVFNCFGYSPINEFVLTSKMACPRIIQNDLENDNVIYSIYDVYGNQIFSSLTELQCLKAVQIMGLYILKESHLNNKGELLYFKTRKYFKER